MAPLATAALRALARPLVATAVVAALVVIAPPALASASVESPGRLDEEITDSAGVLGSRTAEVADALDRLAEDTRYQLFVVFVDTFDGLGGGRWADEAALASELGRDDVVLAVAVEDRAYGISVDDAVELDDDQLRSVERQVEDRLRDDDWAGAAVAAADGYRSAALGGSSPGESGVGSGPDDGSGSGTDAGVPWLPLLLLGVAAVVVLLVVRSARRAGRRGRVAGPADRAALPIEELSRRAGAALVAVDDTVRAAEQELGFAEAQFGLETSRPFAAALATAKERVSAAFALRQRLDDARPRTEREHRDTLLQVLALCDEVTQTLDARTAELERLRDLQRRAPEVLTETARRGLEVAARLPVASATLQRLGATYPDAALATVRGNVEQATALLEASRTGVEQARGLLSSDRATAVRLLRPAQEAVGQASALLDAVDRAGADLAAANDRIDAAVTSLGADVAEAARLAPDDAAVRPAVQTAQSVLAAAAAERTTGDPLALLRRLGDAETALDAALAPLRAQAEQAERARAGLAALLPRVTSHVSAISEFITTRRGAVGPEARTRLAEATRLAQEAERLAPSDPAAALAAAQRAEQLAVTAQQTAEADVARFAHDGLGPIGSGVPGTVGGSNPFGGNAGALILGGILLDRVLGGGGGGGGGWGGGSRGRSRGSRSGGGGFGGGRSFGGGIGGGRRGGRGGGGRF